MAKAAPGRKPLEFVGSSLQDLREFPGEVRREMGTALLSAQSGREHPAVTIFKGQGSASVREVRVNDASGTYRVVFTVQFPKAIYALHSFKKKSKKGISTPKHEMAVIQLRLKAAKEHYANNYG
jgi:phage-related protein